MIVATRTLKLRDGEKNLEIPISIHAPTCHRLGAWECRYDVGWPEGLRSYAGWGADSVQALVITLGMIGAELYASSYHEAGNLFWDKPGNGYGFPVASTIRDLLQGDDAKFL